MCSSQVPAGVKSKTGGVLEKEVSFTFSLPALKVSLLFCFVFSPRGGTFLFFSSVQLIRHYPSSDDVLQTLRPTIFLEFDQKINRSSLLSFIKYPFTFTSSIRVIYWCNFVSGLNTFRLEALGAGSKLPGAIKAAIGKVVSLDSGDIKLSLMTTEEAKADNSIKAYVKVCPELMEPFKWFFITYNNPSTGRHTGPVDRAEVGLGPDQGHCVHSEHHDRRSFCRRAQNYANPSQYSLLHVSISPSRFMFTTVRMMRQIWPLQDHLSLSDVSHRPSLLVVGHVLELNQPRHFRQEVLSLASLRSRSSQRLSIV
jgi:hypothetical protein